MQHDYAYGAQNFDEYEQRGYKKQADRRYRHDSVRGASSESILRPQSGFERAQPDVTGDHQEDRRMHVSQETAEESWHFDSPAVRYGHANRTAPNLAIRAVICA